MLVATRASLISAGTEKMKVDVAKKSLLGKAMERPDQVKKVIESVRQQGLLQTYEKVMNKLDTPTPLGYSSAGRRARGRASEVGRVPGRRPRRLRRRGLRGARRRRVRAAQPRRRHGARTRRSSAAAFTTLGAIALQGVRQAEIRLGEDVVVIGLGLVGLLTVQLLQARAARASIGIELDPVDAPSWRRALGCDRVVDRRRPRGARGGAPGDRRARRRRRAGHRGVVARAARSMLAGELCRDRGRVVVVGITKMDLPHRAYYDKELSLVLSRSYGPGRYDPSYEEQGVDYPLGYVRWTERRNMQEFLRLVEAGRVQVDPLISHRIPFAEAERAYALITGKATEPLPGHRAHLPGRGRAGRAGRASSPRARRRRPSRRAVARTAGEPVGVGFLGAGNFATSMLLPHLKARPDVKLTGVVTASGLTARGAAEKFGFALLRLGRRRAVRRRGDRRGVRRHAPPPARRLRRARAARRARPCSSRSRSPTTADELARVAAAARDVAATSGTPGAAAGRLQPPLRAAVAEARRALPARARAR